MTTYTAAFLLSLIVGAGDTGNRLTYLDAFCDPYYVNEGTARFVTPQWIGDPSVDAAIVLANDDHREPAHHEQYFRPILQRLKQIDGRAGVSFMSNRLDTTDPQLPRWLKEGVSIEAHTYDHPCPCLHDNDFTAAKTTYDRCIDMLSTIPHARITAFRMPCCDSMNSVSPRFFTEIFNRTTPEGHFLTIDSSVFHIFSGNDSTLPKHLAFDQLGRERFRKYVPSDRLMINLIEDYPYPYVIGRLCWEIPCLMPSDWDAQHLNGKCSPATVVDLKAAVDAVVAKQGIFSFCFHTHGWIRNDQTIDMIDHAVTNHGTRIQFLSFREVQDRIDANVLLGHPVRTKSGQDNGVRFLDLNNDGYMDVVIGNEQARLTRFWQPDTRTWKTTSFPATIVQTDDDGTQRDTGVRFGVLESDGMASLLIRNETTAGLWHFDGDSWHETEDGLAGAELNGPIKTSDHGRDQGVRLRDLDGDGICELIVGSPSHNAVFARSAQNRTWRRLSIRLPDKTMIVDDAGRDAGLRFIDVDQDGRDDIIFSNSRRYSLHTFVSMETGWSKEILKSDRAAGNDIPMIVRADGTNNGAWFSRGHMWVQNEETGKVEPDHVDQRSFESLLAEHQSQAHGIDEYRTRNIEW